MALLLDLSVRRARWSLAVSLLASVVGCSGESSPDGMGDAGLDARSPDDGGIDVTAPDARSAHEDEKCITVPCVLIRTSSRASPQNKYFFIDLAEPDRMVRYGDPSSGDEYELGLIGLTSARDAVLFERTAKDYSSHELVRIEHDDPSAELVILEDLPFGSRFDRIPGSEFMLAHLDTALRSASYEIFSFVPDTSLRLRRLHPQIAGSIHSMESSRISFAAGVIVTRLYREQGDEESFSLAPESYRSPLDASTAPERIDFERDGWRIDDWSLSEESEPRLFVLYANDEQRVLVAGHLDDSSRLTEIAATEHRAGGIVSAHWTSNPGQLMYYTAESADSYSDSGTFSVTLVDSRDGTVLVDNVALGEGRHQCEIFESAPSKIICWTTGRSDPVTSMISLDQPDVVVELFEDRIYTGVWNLAAFGPEGRFFYFDHEAEGRQVVKRIDVDRPDQVEVVFPRGDQRGNFYGARLSADGEWIAYQLKEFTPGSPEENFDRLYVARFDALDEPLLVVEGSEAHPDISWNFDWSFAVSR